MAIKLICTACRAEEQIEPERAGQTVRCACGADNVVPHSLDLTRDTSSGGETRPVPGGAVESALPPAAARLLSTEARLLSRSSQRFEGGSTLGAGGMGRVLDVHDRDLRRDVAMKVMRHGAQQDPVRVHRFVEEAQVTGQLAHPNIVPVHELGVTDAGQLYFTMKRVGGESLKELIEALFDDRPGYAARYGLVQRLNLFLKVCNAVGFAHSRGVIHRDLKPQNVMVGQFGEVYVMDWGLAKVRGRADPRAAPGAGAVQSDRSATDSASTMDGQVFGTPRYMPPEQARGLIDQLDERSDIYSLGAMLYELLALKPAFEAGSVMELLMQVGDGAFPPPGEGPGHRPVPRELAAVVCQAMAREQARRYASVQELAAEIEAYLGGYGVRAHRDSPWVAAARWLRRHPAAVAGIAAGVVALVAGVFAMRFYQQAAVARQVESLLGQARQSIRAGRPEDAQVDAIKALALRPADEQARGLLSRAVLEVERARGRRHREAEARALRGQLVEARAAALGAGGDRPRWYRLHSAWLNTAQKLRRLETGDAQARAEVVAAARAIAAQLVADGSFEMAHLMVSEARDSGLDPRLEQVDRWRIEHARNKRGKQAVARVREMLRRLAAAPPAGRLAELQGQALRLAEPDVVRLLIGRLFGGSVWQRRLAIGVLGLAGDAKTAAPLALSVVRAAWNSGRGQDGGVRACFARLEREWLAGGEGGLVRLDACRALALRLLCLRIGEDDAFDEAVRVARALGRLKDARGSAALGSVRWQAGAGSLFWRRTEQAYRAMPLLSGAADGRALLAHGDPAAAVRALSLQLEQRPGASELLLDRALARLQLAAVAAGLADCAAVTAGSRARWLAGLLHATGGDTRRAAAELQRVPQGDPLFARAQLELGRLEYAAGRAAQAIQRCDTALAVDRRLAEARLLRGRAQLLLGRRHAALADLTLAVQLEPESARALAARARAWLELGRPHTALADAAQAVRLAPGLALAHRRLGQAHAALDRLDQALADYNRAVQLDPRDRQALFERGRLLRRRYRFAASIADFTRLIELDPRNPAYLLQRAISLADHGNFDEATADLERVLQLDASSAEAHYQRARIHFGRKRPAEARADLARALAANPRHAPSHLLLGRIAFEAERLDEALLQLRRGLPHARGKTALRLREYSARALALRARQRSTAGDLDGAIADLRAAVEQRPDHWPGWVELGGALARKGRRDEALAALREARRRAPQPLHARIDEWIRQIGGK